MKVIKIVSEIKKPHRLQSVKKGYKRVEAIVQVGNTRCVKFMDVKKDPRPSRKERFNGGALCAL